MSAGTAGQGHELSAALSEWVRGELLAVSSRMKAEGMPAIEARGQLIRPLVALAALSSLKAPPAGFWEAVLAVQLAHEASLVHDDILDGASVRRGEPTEVARSGIPAALVHGDHLLTAAYRAAASTASLSFVTLFARSVERTVAGEVDQGRAMGSTLDLPRYREIALGKAGELLGCSLAAGAAVEGRGVAGAHFDLGRRVGLFYQMVDDLLDYCASAGTGKPPLGDYAQGRWTWVLHELTDLRFRLESSAVLAELHAPREGGSFAMRALRRLEAEAERLRSEADFLLPNGWIVGELIGTWLRRAQTAVDREAGDFRALGTAPAIREVVAPDEAALLRARVPPLGEVEAYLGANSRSFRFASRFFSSADAGRVARVYAYCRVTDDLVDRPADADPRELLERWLELSGRAYEGYPSGLPLLDAVMAEMAAARIPFLYAAELVEGMRMDLGGERYESLADLRRYTYRVASVVGLWLTRLFDVHDVAVLERAARLGHAMQLTNILRDVGEDWRRGRLYLPAAILHSHGVSAADLTRMGGGAPVSEGYRAALEELIGVAEADYRSALAALPALPAAFARPVAVAAHVYRGIHNEIRRRGHDNFRQRAHTTSFARLRLAMTALWELHQVSRPVPAPAIGSLIVPGTEP